MEALARHGAKVLDLRAVAYAKKHGVTIHARSSSHENKGTLVSGERRKQSQVIGVASLTKLIKLELAQADPQLARAAVEMCGAENVYFDTTAKGGLDILISTLNMPEHEHVCRQLSKRFDGRLKLAHDVGSVSIVGSGVGRSDESATHLRSTLDSKTNALQSMFSTADTRTCIVDEKVIPEAVRALHRRFVERQPKMAAA
jgi:aspartate kinase